MADFEEDLQTACHTQAGPFLRPFAPNPKWHHASAFIVGTNPATPLRTEFESFDEYWTGLTLQPTLFEARYDAQHNGGTSKTTRWVRCLACLLSPINCLITNRWWYPAPEQKQIPRVERIRSEALLKRLMRHCGPKAYFFHGSKAVEFAEAHFGVELDRYAPPQQQDVVVAGTLVLVYHHLTGRGLRAGTRFRPDQDVPAFAARIRDHIRRF